MDKHEFFKTLSLPGIDPGEDAIKKEVWAIGGGKGGTGKTFLSTNLGVALAKAGKKVLLVDADLGCANLHTCLGVNPEVTLSDFIHGKVDRIEDVLIQTEIPNLALISGAYAYLEIANPKYTQKMKFIRKIHGLDFEYTILDLGAGTAYANLDFFLSASQGILNVIPEPTSIENTYSFIKSTFYRRFKRVARDPAVRKVVTTAINEKNQRGIRTPHDLIDYIDTLDKKTGHWLKEKIYSYSPKLVVNQVRSKDDITLGFSMRSSCLKYFGIKVDYVGSIEYDDHVWRATKKKRPLLIEYPSSRASRSVERAVTNLLEKEELNFDLILRT
ncbi:MAG: AAA family ATPase [Nitrospiria bacterium]